MIEGGTLPDVTKWLETYLIKMKDVFYFITLIYFYDIAINT